jgi:hypothetical protein
MHAAPIEFVSNGQHANLKRDTDVQDSLEYSKGLPFLVSQFVLVEIWKLLVVKKIVNCPTIGDLDRILPKMKRYLPHGAG